MLLFRGVRASPTPKVERDFPWGVDGQIVFDPHDWDKTRWSDANTSEANSPGEHFANCHIHGKKKGEERDEAKFDDEEEVCQR